ncbi:hypothetical protein AVEN_657-1 [Araneus ventricosus]|uniref:Uncharacterized protein n=1 Tax=Araneus ventricosus TaxID=182803 RepID=A0A4Y2BVC1_ARAVE|nr:hypothetical protein AVEN_657-1 [Araneus ventricosus]
MCPKKCVTPHSGSVASRTDFLANSKKSTCKKRLKVEGRSSPIRPGPHSVHRTDLSYFCVEVRNNTRDFRAIFSLSLGAFSRLPQNDTLGSVFQAREINRFAAYGSFR